MSRFSEGEFDISIKTLQHLEPLLEKELRDLGATHIEIGKRIVHTKGNLKFLYRCNLELRTALRVLVPIIDFRSRNPEDLYRRLLKFPWESVIEKDQTFAFDAAVNSRQYKLPHYAALKAKDALADYFMERSGERPSVDTENPDVRFLLHIDEENVTLSIDSSGESLNRRGYRVRGGEAPLNEVLAAAMVIHTGWKGETDLYNPMCGSATFAIEAAYVAQNMPACWNRDGFGFMTWRDFNENLWKEILKEAMEKFVEPTGVIYASDVEPRALGVAKLNIEEAGFDDYIVLEKKDFFEILPEGNPGVVVLNPPYGERMDPDQLDFLYKRIGDHFKKNWPGFKAWVISSNLQALKFIGLKTAAKKHLMNGPLECKFQAYELFRGERASFVKEKKQGSSENEA
jgi:putative N6-adenine-specific DNA methylase